MFSFLPKSFSLPPMSLAAPEARCEFTDPGTRTLMSAVPRPLQTTGTALGTELRITGTAGNDAITIKQRSHRPGGHHRHRLEHDVQGQVADVRIDGGAGNDVIAIDSTVRPTWFSSAALATTRSSTKGSGTDSLYRRRRQEQAHRRHRQRYAGQHQRSADTLTGGTGLDSFWADNTGDVIMRHRY